MVRSECCPCQRRTFGFLSSFILKSSARAFPCSPALELPACPLSAYLCSVPSPPSSLPGGPAPTALSPSPVGVLLTASFPHSWKQLGPGVRWPRAGERAGDHSRLVLSLRLARGCSSLGPRSHPPRLLLRAGGGEGLVLVCLLANTRPSHASQCTQGLTPSACCQVLSVFSPKASDCFLKKPDPRAYTKAGAARGETPFSPALSLAPPPP